MARVACTRGLGMGSGGLGGALGWSWLGEGGWPALSMDLVWGGMGLAWAWCGSPFPALLPNPFPCAHPRARTGLGGPSPAQLRLGPRAEAKPCPGSPSSPCSSLAPPGGVVWGQDPDCVEVPICLLREGHGPPGSTGAACRGRGGGLSAGGPWGGNKWAPPFQLSPTLHLP